MATIGTVRVLMVAKIESSSSRNDSPRPSANKPDVSPGSEPRSTSTHSTNGSPISNSKPLTSNNKLAERDEDLAAARAANRELMTHLNSPTR